LEDGPIDSREQGEGICEYDRDILCASDKRRKQGVAEQKNENNVLPDLILKSSGFIRRGE
jgi:hypothetical protein